MKSFVKAVGAVIVAHFFQMQLLKIIFSPEYQLFDSIEPFTSFVFSPTLVLQHLSGRHNIHKIRLCHTMLPLSYECVMPKPLKLAIRIELIKMIIATSFTNKAKHANNSCSITHKKCALKQMSYHQKSQRRHRR